MPTAAALVPTGVLLRDDNDSPIQGYGLSLSNNKILTGNNATVAVPIFHVTGSVLVNVLFGVITTALGANNTAAYWRLNDQANQSNITVNTGTTLTSAGVGSIIVKKDVASAALTLLSNSQERVSEPTTLETFYFSPFVAVQKVGAVTTDIEFVYSTTDTPTSGAITFYVQYLPLGSGSRLIVA